MTTPSLISTLRALEQAVTPGEWTSCGATGDCSCGLIWNKKIDAVVACAPNSCEYSGIGCDIVEKPEVRKATRELVVALRNAAPAFLAVVERAQAAVEAWEIVDKPDEPRAGCCPNCDPDVGYQCEGCFTGGRMWALRNALRSLDAGGE
jgi:hypothetical protein